MKTLAMLALAAALALPSSHAAAQAASALGEGPLALDAADGVEWRQEERIFVAEGNAVARQAGVTLKAKRLVASYREAPGGGLEIFKVDAEGAVRIENAGDTAEGGRGVFDLEGRTVVLSGPGARYASGDVSVTAGQQLEYYLDERRAVARGGAKVNDAQGAITAGVIEARLEEGRGVSRAEAWGGVVIRTAKEVIQAERARYDFKARRANAEGRVRITRGQNVLTGARASIDFNTGISRLSGGGSNSGAGGDGRVRGLVFPKAER